MLYRSTPAAAASRLAPHADESEEQMAPRSSPATMAHSDPTVASTKVTASTYVQEVVTGVCTVFQELPAVGAVCKTLLSFQKLVSTAKGNRKELAVLLELCDVVTKGALNRWSEHPGPHEGLAALRKHVEHAKRVAAMCNKGALARFALSRKISRNIVSVKTNIVNFATVHNLALSTALHAKLAKMEAALAAKEKQRQKAEDAVRRAAMNEAEQAEQIRATNPANTRSFSFRDWYGARQESVVFKTADRVGIRRPGLLLVASVLLIGVACGQKFIRRG